MVLRTGIVAATIFIKQLCHVLTTWRPAMDGVIAAAVGSGTITSAQQATLSDWLNKAQAACDIIRLVSHY